MFSALNNLLWLLTRNSWRPSLCALIFFCGDTGPLWQLEGPFPRLLAWWGLSAVLRCSTCTSARTSSCSCSLYGDTKGMARFCPRWRHPKLGVTLGGLNRTMLILLAGEGLPKGAMFEDRLAFFKLLFGFLYIMLVKWLVFIYVNFCWSLNYLYVS